MTPPEIPRITIAAPRRPGGPWTVLPNHAVETVIGQRGVVTAKNQRAAWIIAEDLARQFAATIPPPKC